jgi:hypothetical protein
VGGRRFIYAGNTTPVRALAEIVAVFSRLELAGDHLFIAGPQTHALESMLAAASSNVTYFGQIPHRVMTSLLNRFDAGFAIYKPTDANNRLASPTKIFEYLYFGLSVIASQSPYVRRVASRMPAGSVRLIEEVSVDCIAAACVFTQRRSDRRPATPRHGILWAHQLETVESIYRSVAPAVSTVSPEGRFSTWK